MLASEVVASRPSNSKVKIRVSQCYFPCQHHGVLRIKQEKYKFKLEQILLIVHQLFTLFSVLGLHLARVGTVPFRVLAKGSQQALTPHIQLDRENLSRLF